MSAAENTDPMLDAALAYAAVGLRVVPIRPGMKAPALSKWTDAATTDRDTIVSWWQGLYRGHGVGIALGELPDGRWAFCVDIDDHGIDGGATWRDICNAYPDHPVEDSWEATTGGAGTHIILAAPYEVRSGNIGPGVDIKGSGGQILVEPTIHPNGSAYRWDADCAPWERPIADAPGWLLALVTPDEPATTPATNLPVSTATVGGASDRPGDLWAAATSWDDILTADGWTCDGPSGDGGVGWVRPGKLARDGISATVGYKGADVLVVFTSSLPNLPPGNYGKFGYLAQMHHGGDYSAAGRALVEQGYGATPAAMVGDIGTYTPAVTPTGEPEWGDPQPLTRDQATPPAFPVHVLPEWAVDHAHAIAGTFQVPVDLPAQLILGALSVVTTGHAIVDMAGTGWREHLNLYLCSSMPPGSGKSPVYKHCMAPVRALELRLASGKRTDIYAAEERHRQLDQRITKMQKSDDADPLEIAKLRAQLADLDVPAEPRLTAEDITPEALVELMAKHNGRMAIISDEGGIFDMMAGQYAAKGAPVNLSVYLQGFSGGTVTRDRRSGEPIKIANALLTVCVTTQPAVLSRIGENPEMAGRGLTARFMYSVPPSMVGYRDRRAVLTKIPDDVARNYSSHVEGIGWTMAGWEQPRTLSYTPDAIERFVAWDQQLERRHQPGRDMSALAEWASKLRSSVLRTSGLLHIAHGYGHDEPVTIDTLDLALEVGDYWITHAKIVHDAWTEDPVTMRAREILQWAIRNGVERFTARELNREKRALFSTIQDVVEPLEMLVEAGWLHPLEGMPIVVGVRGKPSPTFIVHPDAEGKSWVIGGGTTRDNSPT